MEPRITKPEFNSAVPAAATGLTPAQTVALQAMRARDEAIGQWVRNTVRAVFRAIVEYPRRRRVYDELTMLTDRELADIGLTRGDIPFLFKDGFVAREEAPVAAAPAPAPAAANSNAQAQGQRLAA